MIKSIKTGFVVIFCLCSFVSLSQKMDFPMNEMKTSDWEKSNWEPYSSVKLFPANSAPIALDVNKANPLENSILYTDKANASLKTSMSFKDFKIRFELLQSSNANLVLKLRPDASILLTKKNFGDISFGAENTKKAIQNVSKSAGLWQNVEVVFKSNIASGSNIIESISINGIAVQENVFFQSKYDQKESISFQNLMGSSAIKNVSYLQFEDKKPATLSNISYSIQQTKDWQDNFSAMSTPLIKGTLEKVTHELPHDYNRYITTYTGDLVLSEDNTYAFTLDYAGVSNLYIDDKWVAGSKEGIRRIPQSGIMSLKEGKHVLKLEFSKLWWPSALGLYIGGSDFRPYPVHEARSLPAPRIVPGIYESPSSSQPQIIRSFLMHHGEKRTEVVSVGSNTGIHYSIDLENGSLLSAWKGKFADVTEMWFERGEPQLLSPMGMQVELSGEKQFYDDYMSDLLYKSYKLDVNGNPTFYLELGDLKVSESFTPTKEGLKCSIATTGKSKFSYILASGKKLEKITPNIFKVDEYYVYTRSAQKLQMVEVDEGNIQLIAEGITENNEFNYEINW